MSSVRSKGDLAEIDKKLSDQVNLILPCGALSAGGERLARAALSRSTTPETDEMLKIPGAEHLEEGARQGRSRKYKGGRWDQSPLFKKVTSRSMGSWEVSVRLPGGDYYFDHTPGDVELLG